MSRGLINTCTPWIWIYKWLQTKRQCKLSRARPLNFIILCIHHHIASRNWWNLSFSLNLKQKKCVCCLSLKTFFFFFAVKHMLEENVWYHRDWMCSGTESSNDGKRTSTSLWLLWESLQIFTFAWSHVADVVEIVAAIPLCKVLHQIVTLSIID